MQLLIAVKSSFAAMQAGAHDRVRGTWGAQFRGKAHVKFFLGRDTETLGGVSKSLTPGLENSYITSNDEVIVECFDGPQGDVKKVRRMCGFISSKALSHILIVDVNSLVDPEAVLSAPYGAFDYAGTFDNWGDIGPREFVSAKGETVVIPRCYDFAKAEHGVILSRKAALEIAVTPPHPAFYVNGQNWDVWIGQVVGSLIAEESFLTLPIDPLARRIN